MAGAVVENLIGHVPEEDACCGTDQCIGDFSSMQRASGT
jgi:hypothetical protein